MDDLAGFVLAALALTGSPGPANLSLAACGVAFGVRRGLPLVFGIISGVIAVMLMTATGFAALVIASPLLGTALAFAAAAYIAWLAWRIATAPPLSDDAGERRQPSVVAGMFVSLVNPKAYAAMAALFSAAAEQGHVQASNMARALGTPRGDPPTCLLPPADDPVTVAVAEPPARAERAGRGPLVAPPRLPPNAPAPIVRFVELVAPEYGLEPHLVLAVMATESNFDPWAVSPRNARGLMQLIPDTARRFRVRDLTDPADNIRGGMAYLRWLLAYFEGDLKLALAAYNAGERAVERYRGVPPFAETRMYVRKVIALMGGQQAHTFDPQATAPSGVMPLIRGKVAAR